jgi:hypothetical protein
MHPRSGNADYQETNTARYTDIVFDGGKYSLAAADSMPDLLATTRLTARRQIRKGRGGGYATKDS